MITLPRPIQSVGMDLHDVSGTSTGQTLPRERKAPPGTHLCPTIWWVYPPFASIFILHPQLSTFSYTCVRNIPTFDHSSTLKRRPQTSVTAAETWCGSAPRRGPSANGYDAWRLDPADPGARSLQVLLQTWCGSAPRCGPSANGYDAWRFGSCGPTRKTLAAAATDLVWVCAPPRTIRIW